MSVARVLAASAHLSLGEFFSLYPPRLYFIAFVPRIVFSLAFFGLLAQFLGGPEYLRFVVIGNVGQATFLGALSFTVASVTWEQGAGTVPLLVASPGNPILVFVSRNLAMLFNGALSASLTLALATVVLGLDLTVAEVLGAAGIVLLLSSSVYCLGLLLGSIVLRFPQYRNVMSNIAAVTLTFLTGTYVPVSALPTWIQPVSEILPVTHGLRVLRHLALGAPDPGVSASLAAEIVIGLVLLGLAFLSFRYFLREARIAGTLDFH